MPNFNWCDCILFTVEVTSDRVDTVHPVPELIVIFITRVESEFCLSFSIYKQRGQRRRMPNCISFFCFLKKCARLRSQISSPHLLLSIIQYCHVFVSHFLETSSFFFETSDNVHVFSQLHWFCPLLNFKFKFLRVKILPMQFGALDNL